MNNDENAQTSEAIVHETGSDEASARTEAVREDPKSAAPSQASEVALARWPDDTVIHAALRNAFVDGAIIFGRPLIEEINLSAITNKLLADLDKRGFQIIRRQGTSAPLRNRGEGGG